MKFQSAPAVTPHLHMLPVRQVDRPIRPVPQELPNLDLRKTGQKMIRHLAQSLAFIHCQLVRPCTPAPAPWSVTMHQYGQWQPTCAATGMLGQQHQLPYLLEVQEPKPGRQLQAEAAANTRYLSPQSC